jgi:hypothetical protein
MVETLVAMLWCDLAMYVFGRSLESGKFCVGVFGKHLASVAILASFSIGVWHSQKGATVNFCKDNAGNKLFYYSVQKSSC